MWFHGKKVKEEVRHEVLQVKHKQRPNGTCMVWVVCSCGISHAYTKIGEDNDDGSGVHTMARVDAPH